MEIVNFTETRFNKDNDVNKQVVTTFRSTELLSYPDCQRIALKLES